MYTFDEIMNYQSGNWAVYEEIKNNLAHLVPFVGAGLTAFAFCGWGQALVEIAENLKNNPDAKKRVEAQIADGDYLKAAQTMEDELTPDVIARAMAKLFSSDKLGKKAEELPKQAVYLLPKLFDGLVITTNFDETIEIVYNQQEPMHNLPVAHPGHSQWLSQRLYERERGLFKLHGTVSGGTVEYDDIVFTAGQYRRHYGMFSKLPKELARCFESRAMLFLGCSLTRDKTMEVLEKVTRHSQYKYNYAVIDCAKGEQDAKVKEQESRSIRAIVYETGRYEAVRVILEQLLKDTRWQVYDGLRYKLGALRMIRAKDRFDCENDSLPLVGRKRELERLLDFANHDTNGGWWWALTGPGGSGKSKLVYELKKRLGPEWDIVKLHDYKSLSSLTEHITRPTMFIADDAQTRAAELGQWMTELSGYAQPRRVRLLLVERDNNTDWINSLLNNSGRKCEISDWCYDNTFLKLEPLADGELLNIIENYAEYLGDLGFTGWERVTKYGSGEILNQLRRIDSDYSRPLYAMILTDLFVDGSSESDWKDDIFAEASEREKERVGSSIADVLGRDRMQEKLTNDCLYLMSLSTVMGGLTVKESKTLCGEKWDRIIRRSEEAELDGEVFLRRIGAAEEDRILPIKPDIIGEYTVLDWLLEQERPAIREFVERVWTKPEAGMFWRRLIRDYWKEIDAIPEQWEMLFPMDLAPVDREARLEYAETLAWVIAGCSDYRRRTAYLDILRTFASEDGYSVDFTVKLMKGLAELSARVPFDLRQELACELEELYNRDGNRDVADIAALYAKGLVNLSAKQKLEGRTETVDRLRQVYECGGNRDVADIAALYASGLVNLSANQELEGRTETVDRLRQVYEYGGNRDVADIAVIYAKGLYNLTPEQELEGCVETVDRLRQVYEYGGNRDVADIVVAYAKGLVNLSAKQELEGCTETVDRLRQVYEYGGNRDVADIAVEYATGLVNLSAMQNAKGCAETVRKLREIYEYRDNGSVPEIIEEMMRGTANLIGEMASSRSREAYTHFDFLRELYEQNSGNLRAGEYYAHALAMMCFVHPAEAKRALPTVRQLQKENPYSAFIAAQLASALFHTGNWQDASALKITVDEIEGIYRRYGAAEKHIADTFALSLAMLYDKQSDRQRPETLNRLRALLRTEQISDEKIVTICRILHCSREELFGTNPLPTLPGGQPVAK